MRAHAVTDWLVGRCEVVTQHAKDGTVPAPACPASRRFCDIRRASADRPVHLGPWSSKATSLWRHTRAGATSNAHALLPSRAVRASGWSTTPRQPPRRRPRRGPGHACRGRRNHAGAHGRKSLPDPPLPRAPLVRCGARHAGLSPMQGHAFPATPVATTEAPAVPRQPAHPGERPHEQGIPAPRRPAAAPGADLAEGRR